MSINVGVVGAGAMGSAISQTVALNCNKVYLYARRKEICNQINSEGYNFQYFPNVKLHDNILAVNSLDDLKEVEVIFLCIPSSAVRETVDKLKEVISTNCILVNTAKGIEEKTNMTMTKIIEEISGRQAIVLSGPNIASEMVKNYFGSTTIAGAQKTDLNKVKSLLESNKFKVSCNDDVIGTEYCGIIKNVIAISQGILEGMDINDNARFTLFTKSYNEAKLFIEKVGGNSSTVDDYCGFGDIITASTLNVSRNHTLGILYGQKIVIDEKASGVVFEGKNTTKFLKILCDSLNFECLTVNFVYDIIINKKNPKSVFNEFWHKI